MLEAVFGSVAAERTLLYLQNYGEGYSLAIAETFGMSASQVGKQLMKLENGGFLVSRPVGRARVYTWNVRNPLVKELRRLLQATLEVLPENQTRKYYRQRRRPRRKAKPN
ncbi:MAG: ArsR family transcriptional regulator [Acidobacteriota bacterium]